MASVNFAKLTRQKLGALHVHLDKDARAEHNHANRHIDTALTHLNSFIGCEDYHDIVRAVDERVKAVDADSPPLRRNRDRVVACSLEAPCPAPITEAGRSDEFFELFYELLREFFGADNVCGGTSHRDEVHNYADRDGTIQTSLEHAHYIVVPYAEWTDAKGRERKGINGKHWETREMLTRFNQAVNDMCLREFGLEYNTHGLAEHKTVEELKRRSDSIEVTQRDQELIDRHNHLVDQIAELTDTYNNLVDRIRDISR